MKNWIDADLASLIKTIQSGGRPKGGANEESGEIPSLGGENIQQSGGIDLTSVRMVPSAFFRHMTKGVLQNEDVLINKDGANTGKVGLYYSRFPEASINEHVFLLRGQQDKLSQSFLYYLLLSQIGQNEIRGKISGSAQPGLKTSFINEFPVLVPKSVKEQAKIAKVIATVDQAIAQTDVLLAKQQRVKAGLIQELLTRGIDADDNRRDPRTHVFKDSPLGQIPVEWKVENLEQLRVVDCPICYGIVQVGQDTDGGIPTLAIKNMLGDYRTRIHRTDPNIESGYVRSRVKPGDLLLSIKGTTGKVDVVPSNFSGNISRDIARIRLKPSVLPSFAKLYLSSTVGQRLLELATVGTTRREISILPLRLIQLPVPSLFEQGQLVSYIERQTYNTLTFSDQIQKLKKVKAGLMQDLLTGKVSVLPLLDENNTL